MTAIVAGAPSARAQNWNRIDWVAVKALVSRMQSKRQQIDVRVR